MLGSDSNLNRGSPHNPILGDLAGHDIPDHSAYHHSFGRKCQHPIAGPNPGNGDLGTVLLPNQRLGQEAALVVDHDGIRDIGAPGQNHQIVCGHVGGEAPHRLNSPFSRCALLSNPDDVAGPKGIRHAEHAGRDSDRMLAREPQKPSRHHDLTVLVRLDRGNCLHLRFDERRADGGQNLVARLKLLHGNRAPRRENCGAALKTSACSTAIDLGRPRGPRDQDQGRQQ